MLYIYIYIIYLYIYIYISKSRIAPWFFQLIYKVVSAEMVKGSEEEDVSWGGGAGHKESSLAHTKCEIPVKYSVDITHAQVYFMQKLSRDKYFGVVN